MYQFKKVLLKRVKMEEWVLLWERRLLTRVTVTNTSPVMIRSRTTHTLTLTVRGEPENTRESPSQPQTQMSVFQSVFVPVTGDAAVIAGELNDDDDVVLWWFISKTQKTFSTHRSFTSPFSQTLMYFTHYSTIRYVSHTKPHSADFWASWNCLQDLKCCWCDDLFANFSMR